MFKFLKLAARVSDLEEALRNAEHKIKLLELEWVDTLDKVTRLMGRVAKRAAVDDREAEQENPDQPAPPLSQTPLFGTLRPADPISARILARRRRGRPELLPKDGE